MFTQDLLLGGQLWFLTFIFGLITLPLNKGYFLGKLISLFVIAYTAFTLATLKILPLGFTSLIFLTIIWTVVNIIIWLKTKKLELNWKLAIFEEIIFIFLFSFFIFIKGHQPEIYQIERFMDYGFIKALTQSQFLPLEDIWRAGQPLNYYYFGHFLAYVLITLSKIPIVAGFFLVQCWLFAAVGTLAFGIGKSLTKSTFAGFLSLFATIFAGDWQTIINSKFWYPDPTRIIPGTISEIPIYSFIVADLHAHVWGFLLGTVIISVLATKRSLLLFSFLLGLAIMTNTWDFLTLGSIVALILFPKIKHLVFIFAGAIIFSLPWLLFFKSPVGGLGLVSKWSPLGPWFLFWGPTLFLIFLYLFSKKKQKIITILFFSAIFWLAFLEIFYAKDILSGGEWFRANTYFKVSLQVLLWIGLATGPAIFAIISKTKSWSRSVISVVLAVWLLSRLVYPMKAVYQANLENKTYTGLNSGLDFWQQKYPTDFAAFKFLEKQPKGIILEADGDSYQDTNFFSIFLGWPTITGWPVHEWTWQGTYDDVGKRAADVREIYTGKDLRKSQSLLKKYKVKYIIIGSTEKRKYSDLNLKKLKKLCTIIYQNPGTLILESP